MKFYLAARGRALAAAVAIAIGVAACSGGSAGEVTIPVQDPDLVASGGAIYQASCASCHGSDLRGTEQGPSHLSEVYVPSHHSDAAFLLAVRNGSQQHHWRFGNMKPVAGISDDDIVAITAFVRETQRVEGFEPYPP